MSKNPTNFPMPIEDRQYGRIGAGLPDYIHNDTFDENIEKHIYWGMNRNYYRALEAQRRHCNIRQYTLPMSIFKIDNELNNMYGFISNHSSNDANGTHFKTYSAKIAWNVIDHSLVRDVKRLNIVLRDGDTPLTSWKCRNPNKVNTPDADHSYMTYEDNDGHFHTDPWHRPDYKVSGGRDVCDSPTNLFSKKKGLSYNINKSKYLHTFSTEDMCTHSDLFLYRTMFFLNGLLHTNVRYAVDENHLYIFICVDDGYGTGIKDLIPEGMMIDYINYQVPFTLLMMPWGNVMTYDGIGNDESFADGYGLNYHAFTQLTPTMKIKQNFWMMSASWRGTSRWPTSMMTTTFTSINSVKVGDTTKDVFNLSGSSPAMLNSLMNNNLDVHAEAYNIPNVDGYSFIGTSRVIQIPLKGNPVPPNNILLWKYTPANTNNPDKVLDAGTYEFIHNGTITLFYPNVYQINDIPDDIEIAVMWFNDHTHETPDNYFHNVLDSYMRYNSNFASATVNNSLPSYITNYVPAKVTYDYTDYERYNKSTLTDGLTYKVDKLTELMKEDPTRYEHVYEKLMEHTATKLHSNTKQTLDLSTLRDAEYQAAFRSDLSDFDIVPNDVRASTRFDSIEFDEEHLMLTIDHPFITSYEYAVWVDGLECYNAKVYQKFLRTFIYIPKSSLTRYSVIEVEMMRVPEHGRILAEIEFSDADTSIKLPRDFYDVSPQNMLVSIRINTSTWLKDTEMTKKYARQLNDPDILNVSKDFGVTFFYQPAPEYEMAWLLFGYNRYVDGKRQAFDENKKLIKHKQLHETGYTHPYFVEPDKGRNHYYGYVKYYYANGKLATEFTDDTTKITTKTDFEANAIYVALNLANKKFTSSSDGKVLVEFSTSTATFQEINYFKKSYYHWHNNADETFVSANRIIGIPISSITSNDTVRMGFASRPSGDGILDWIIEPDDMDDTALYVVIGDNSYVEYRYNKDTWLLEEIYSSEDEVDDEELSTLTTTLLNASPDGKRWMELYTAFDEDNLSDEDKDIMGSTMSNPVNLESGLAQMRTKDNELLVTAIDYPWCDGFYALERRRFYQYLPYGKDADRDIYITPIGIPSTKTAVDIVKSFNRASSEETVGEITYHPIDSDATNTVSNVERTQYYQSTEYPESYFSHKKALIQNTDIYYKESFTIDYIETNKVSIGHFYDEPTYQRFRVTVNGYRMDHGTDYTTDLNVVNRFIRGDRIVFTFDKSSSHFINAVQRSFRDAPRVVGVFVVEPDESGAYPVLAFQPIDSTGETFNPSASSVYVNSSTGTEYVYNPKKNLLVPYSSNLLADTGFTMANVVIEYMPYKSRIVHKTNALKSNCISLTDQQLTRPISLKYYDIFLGGMKLNSANIKFISPRRIMVNEDLLFGGACLTVYERCHDEDLYGNEIAMPDSMNDIIAQHDPEFRKFLYSGN